MSDPKAATIGQRPSKRARSSSTQDKGPDLKASALLKYNLKLPHGFTPGAVQANRVALRVAEDRCVAYVANAQHVYEVSLGDDFLAARSAPGGDADQGKEGVLVPRTAQVGHIRQLEPLSDMAAEVQSLHAGIHGGHYILAAVDSVGNARVLAEPHGPPAGEGPDWSPGTRQLMSLNAPYRGECGWTGLAIRAPGSTCGGSPAEARDAPVLEVAVARQRLRDVLVYRDGALMRMLHTVQGPTALTYLTSPGPSASSGLLAVAEEHQVTLWDLRQGERGGCMQRLSVYGGGCPVYGLSWVSAADGAMRPQGGSCNEGLLAVTGSERSVVMLEPRKWHIVAKWPGCVKYPATHLCRSALAPGYVYVAGLDYECVAGRWDGSSGTSSGNANSSTGGHGRAMGPSQLELGREQQQQQQPALGLLMDDSPEGAASSTGGLSFRGDSKWLGLASSSLHAVGDRNGAAIGCCQEVTVALSLSGHLFVLLVTSASAAAPHTL